MQIDIICGIYYLLRSIDGAQTVSFRTNDGMNPAAFVASCLSHLLRGQHINIRAHGANAEAIINVFEKLGLETFVISSAEVKDINSVKLSKNQSNYDDKLHTSLQNKLKFINSVRLDFYTYFYSKENHQFSRRELLEKRQQNSVPRGYIDITKLVDLSTNNEDIIALEQLRQEMIKATKLYRQEFRLFNQNNRNEAILQLQKREVLEDRHVLRQQLANFRTNLYGLRKIIINCQESAVSTWQIDFKRKLKLCIEKISQFELDLLTYFSLHGDDTPDKPGLFTIDKNKIKKYNEWEHLLEKVSDLQKFINQQLDQYSEVNSDISSTEELKSVFESVKMAVGNYRNSFANQSKLKSKQINIINSNDEQFKSIYNELNRLTNSINSLKLFNKVYELNAKSAKELKEYAEHMISDIEKAMYILSHDDEYFEWLMFYSDSSANFRMLFDEIKHLPKELWVKTIKQIYIEVLCMHFKVEKVYEYWCVQKIFDETRKKWFDEELNKIRDILYNNFTTSIASIPPKELKSKLKYGASFADFHAHFPIAVSCDEEEDAICVDLIDKAGTIESFRFRIDETNPYVAGDVFVFEYKFNELNRLERSELLEACRLLAKQMISLNTRPKIYSYKDKLIISTWNEHFNDILVHKIFEGGLKDLTQTQISEERWVELLIWSEGKIILLINDKLLDQRNWRTFKEQSLILEELTKSGITIIDLTTQELIENGTELINKIAEQIRPTSEYQREMYFSDKAYKSSKSEEISTVSKKFD